MNIIELKLSEIIPYEKNLRNNDKAIEPVAKSIEEFGFKVPIVIDSNNVIVCGHTRYKAAQKLKLEKVPCIKADDLSEEQIKAFRLADNKTAELAEWDIDLLSEELFDISDIDMAEFGFDMTAFEEQSEPAEIVEDDFDEELPDEPKSKLGDIWQLGRHRLMCGDSTDKATVEMLMDGKKADMVFTDPPYGIDVVKSNKVGGGGATHFGKVGGGKYCSSLYLYGY